MLPLAAPSGCVLEHLAQVSSTNTEALDRARKGVRDALWVVADEQTDGRGRRGRRWTSPPGNLYASRLVIGTLPLARLAELSFVAALAVHDAASSLLSGRAGRALWLKWPNDLMVGEGKVAGVLIETERIGTEIAAAVGIGLNLISSEVVPNSVSLAALGRTASPAEAFGALGEAFEARLGQWDLGSDFSGIREEWMARASRLGAPARVRLDEGLVEGTFGGIDESGALILNVPAGGIRRIAAGEVIVDGARL